MKFLAVLLLCLLLVSSVHAVNKSDYHNYLGRVGLFQQAYTKVTENPAITLENFEYSPGHMITPGSDVVLYVPFNNNASLNESATFIADISQVRNNGTGINLTINATGGYLGDAAAMFANSTVNASVNFSHVSAYNTSTFTLAAWINPLSGAGSIISKDANAGGRAWQFVRASNNRVNFIIFNETANSATLGSNANLNANSWSHVVVSWNGSVMKIYVNGTLDASQTFTGTLRSTGTNRLTIGRLDTSSPTFFNGTIDEAIMYNRTLSDTEVYQLYIGYQASSLRNMSNKGSTFITNMTNSSVQSVSGNQSMVFGYNVTAGSAWWRINLSGRNLNNYSGIGFWMYGDNSNNTIQWVIANSSGSTFVAATNFFQSFKIDFTGWRYVYIDFHYMKQFNTSSDDLSNPLYLQINVDNSSGLGNNNNVTGTLFFDDIAIIDNYKGAMCYPDCPIPATAIEGTNSHGWQYTLTNLSGHLWRLMDGMYLQAWLYKSGPNTFVNNKTVLNYSLYSGDMLVRTQLPTRVWLETQGTIPGWVAHSACVSLGLSYIALENETEMNDTIVLNNWFTNSTANNDTRRNHWKNTVVRCTEYVNITAMPTLNDSIYVTNQYKIAVATEWLAWRITGNISHLQNFNRHMSSINDQIDIYGIQPEKSDSSDVPPIYESGYGAIQKNEDAMLYFLTGNASFLDNLRRSQNATLGFMGYNKKKMYANSSRSAGDFFETDSMMTPAVHNISRQNNFSFLQQSTYYAYANFTNEYDTGNGSLGYVFAWGFFLPFGYDYYADAASTGSKFPTEYGNYSYDLLNATGGFRRRMMNQQTFNTSTFARAKNEFPLHFFAYDNNASWWVRGDTICANTTDFHYCDSNGNFTLPIIPRLNITNNIVAFATSTFTPVVNTTQVMMSGSGNTRTIVSQLGKEINTSLTISTAGIVPSSPRITYPNGSSEYPAYSYENGVMSFTASLPPGTSSLLLVDYEHLEDEELAGYGSDIAEGLTDFLQWFGLIVVALALAGFVGVVNGKVDIDVEQFKTAVFLIVIAMITVVIGIVIVLAVTA